jgi:cystathionine beta-lyase/cystathionine gamma-synthase
MVTARYHKVKIGDHELNAETLMLGYGYDPSLSEGSVKPPVFLTSTFVFQTAEQGRDFSTIWLDAARLRSKGKPASFILASITRTWKSSRIGSRSTKKPQAGWCLPPAWRRSSL